MKISTILLGVVLGAILAAAMATAVVLVCDKYERDSPKGYLHP